MKQLYLQQGYNYQDVVAPQLDNWVVSEKFDGQRAFWDGGISRGKPVLSVPYSNTTKDRRTNYAATGLWSRYGKVIHAAPNFLDQLPVGLAVDMEIWGGYGRFQYTTGIVRSKTSFLWFTLQAIIFDVVPIRNFLRPRHIDLPQADFHVRGEDLALDPSPFWERKHQLNFLKETDQVKVVPYRPGSEADALLEEVMARGGEGIVYRSRDDIWKPERVHTLLKRKPTYKGTGFVIGQTEGKGKYRGMVGALIISSAHGEFQLSGMTDLQRKPGAIPFGSKVTYTYDTLTTAGIPRNARLTDWKKE